jgi:hypothetical protein
LRNARKVTKKINKLRIKHPKFFDSQKDTIVRERIIGYLRDSIVFDTTIVTQLIPGKKDSVFIETPKYITEIVVTKDTVIQWDVRTIVKPDSIFVFVRDTIFDQKQFIPTEVTVIRKTPWWIFVIIFAQAALNLFLGIKLLQKK